MPGYIHPDLHSLRHVLVVPDIQHEYLPEFFPAGALEERRRLYGDAVRRADHICAISEFTRTDPDRATRRRSRTGDDDPARGESGLRPRWRAGDARAARAVRPRAGGYLFLPGAHLASQEPPRRHRSAAHAARSPRPEAAARLHRRGARRRSRTSRRRSPPRALVDRSGSSGIAPREMPALYRGAAALVLSVALRGIRHAGSRGDGLRLPGRLQQRHEPAGNRRRAPRFSSIRGTPRRSPKRFRRVLTDAGLRADLRRAASSARPTFSWRQFTLETIAVLPPRPRLDPTAERGGRMKPPRISIVTALLQSGRGSSGRRSRASSPRTTPTSSTSSSTACRRTTRPSSWAVSAPEGHPRAGSRPGRRDQQGLPARDRRDLRVPQFRRHASARRARARRGRDRPGAGPPRRDGPLPVRRRERAVHRRRASERLREPRRVLEIWKGHSIPQPAVFFTREVWERSGPMDPDEQPGARLRSLLPDEPALRVPSDRSGLRHLPAARRLEDVGRGQREAPRGVAEGQPEVLGAVAPSATVAAGGVLLRVPRQPKRPSRPVAAAGEGRLAPRAGSFRARPPRSRRSPSDPTSSSTPFSCRAFVRSLGGATGRIRPLQFRREGDRPETSAWREFRGVHDDGWAGPELVTKVEARPGHREFVLRGALNWRSSARIDVYVDGRPLRRPEGEAQGHFRDPHPDAGARRPARDSCHLVVVVRAGRLPEKRRFPAAWIPGGPARVRTIRSPVMTPDESGPMVLHLTHRKAGPATNPGIRDRASRRNR